ncbi:hypothetical protein [Terrisporobacter hibernicus]|uniref:Uncharacterized protein n=1 Tax=Terrisporobacter hibernicus TaxID=2813371 RepID=A0AAX2ZIK4_9FIRM|nr:hypothetical protein [Terrisporobacter hibernicus]UEL48210.1 hypothetical protein JW646_01805 [Terrisporobacter hibernicus]
MEEYRDINKAVLKEIDFKLHGYAMRNIRFVTLVNYTYSIQEEMNMSDDFYNAVLDYILSIITSNSKDKSMLGEIMDIIGYDENSRIEIIASHWNVLTTIPEREVLDVLYQEHTKTI